MVIDFFLFFLVAILSGPLFLLLDLAVFLFSSLPVFLFFLLFLLSLLRSVFIFCSSLLFLLAQSACRVQSPPRSYISSWLPCFASSPVLCVFVAFVPTSSFFSLSARRRSSTVAVFIRFCNFLCSCFSRNPFSALPFKIHRQEKEEKKQKTTQARKGQADNQKQKKGKRGNDEEQRLLQKQKDRATD